MQKSEKFEAHDIVNTHTFRAGAKHQRVKRNQSRCIIAWDLPWPFLPVILSSCRRWKGWRSPSYCCLCCSYCLAERLMVVSVIWKIGPVALVLMRVRGWGWEAKRMCWQKNRFVTIFSFFSRIAQYRWPCQLLTHYSHSTFTFDIQRVTQETCDLWNIWSGEITWDDSDNFW